MKKKKHMKTFIINYQQIIFLRNFDKEAIFLDNLPDCVQHIKDYDYAQFECGILSRLSFKLKMK